MRLVQLLYSGLGGHGNVAFSLQQAASTDTGWQHAMIFLGIEPLLSDYSRLCHERQLYSQFIQARRGAPWASWATLFRALGHARPDAIILHSVKAILPAWLYALLQGIPLIAVEHQNNELKTVSERRVSKLLMRLADAVVVLTPAYREALREVVGAAWREDKVHVIANGIDTEQFRPSPRAVEPQSGPRVVGMASRFSTIKRHELLLGAFACLRERGQAASWQLTLAGDGETLAGLRQLAADLGLEDRVTFTGCLDEQQLKSWFAGLDVYVQASDGETLSTSVLQAMSLGLPIVASPVPGLADFLGAGDGCGLLATAQTAEAFADALQLLAERPDLASAMAGRARTLAVQEYSQYKMFERYQELLKSCLKSYT